MNTNLAKKWYAVYTRPRWEKKVSEILTKKGIENYCPLNRVVRQWSDRKKVVNEPLFTSYVFVRTNEREHVQLKQTSGVINMVYWLKKPAIIRDVEIEMIQRFLNEHTNVKLEKTTVNVYDMVKVISGPLMEQEGQVIGLKNKTVKIILPSMGYMMCAEVEMINVELIRQGLHYSGSQEGNLALH
ncbi:MAG: UpxY family transcription antiterminator [Chitinophagaceae bacterium]